MPSGPPPTTGLRRAVSALVLALLLVLGGGAALLLASVATVEVHVDGEVLTTRTFATDVAGVLGGLGVVVGPADRIEPAPEAVVHDGMRIVVTSPTVVTVTVDGEVRAFTTLADTVADALTDAGVEVGADDLVGPPLDGGLDTGTHITVRRVEVVEEKLDVAIEPLVRRVPSADLDDGETRVASSGRDGILRETHEVTLVDGDRTGRVLLAEELVREPIDRVVLVGVAPAPIAEAQRLLADLGYPVGVVDGVDGPRTRRGLCAWRRLEGGDASRSALRPGELEALRAGAGLPAAASAGRGVTVDRTCQAVYVRDGGRWQHVHAASTGAGGLPREGSYVIGRAREGWHTSTLYPASTPNMYNSLYFHGAIAIHGSNDVPPHPASSGCVRVTPSAADQLFGDLRIGDPVRVIGTW